jgi:hypothetical protein
LRSSLHDRPGRGPRTAGPLAILAAGLILALPFGCDRAGDQSPSRPRILPLRETFDWLRGQYQAGAYGALRLNIVPEQREPLIDLLLTVDRLMAANAAAQTVAARRFPSLDVRRYDLAPIREHLDLFAARVEWIGERTQGDTAEVTVQIARRLPLERLRFVRREGAWMYVPGPGDPQALAALAELTRTLQRLTTFISSAPLTSEGAADEFRLRLEPRLAELRTLGRSAASAPQADSRPA